LKARSNTIEPEESKLQMKRSSLFDSSRMSKIEQAPVAYNDAQENILKSLGFENPEKMSRTAQDWTNDCQIEENS
jgi:hypothetical protein